MTDAEQVQVKASDLTEMLVGGAALAYPVALAQETWDLGAQLPWLNVLLLLAGSVFVLGWFGLHAFHGGVLRANLN